jgi:protein N-terminal asparagine amidohydrolase
MDINFCAYEQGSNALAALMKHSTLVSVSNSLKAIPERKFSVNEESSQERSKKSKWVYVFQREYATVDPALVDVCLFLNFLGKLLVIF